MPSFDVVSELDKHEVTNAVDNALKELDRRYDLRGKGTFEFKELTVHLTADADFQLEQMLEILKVNLAKRKIDVQCLEVKDAYASGKTVKQETTLREGIDKELAKKIGLSPGAPTVFDTFGGRVAGRIVPEASVRVGGIRVDGIRVGVGATGRQALLGQNFLNKIELSQTGERMTLRVERSN